MKKLIITILGISLLVGIGVGAYYYAKQPKSIPKQEDFIPSEYPCIHDGILYTRIKVIPLSYIYKVEVVNAEIRFIIIHWKKNNTDGGMFTMRVEDFIKISKQMGVLKGVKYVQTS